MCDEACEFSCPCLEIYMAIFSRFWSKSDDKRPKQTRRSIRQTSSECQLLLSCVATHKYTSPQDTQTMHAMRLWNATERDPAGPTTQNSFKMQLSHRPQSINQSPLRKEEHHTPTQAAWGCARLSDPNPSRDLWACNTG